MVPARGRPTCRSNPSAVRTGTTRVQVHALATTGVTGICGRFDPNVAYEDAAGPLQPAGGLAAAERKRGDHELHSRRLGHCLALDGLRTRRFELERTGLALTSRTRASARSSALCARLTWSESDEGLAFASARRSLYVSSAASARLSAASRRLFNPLMASAADAGDFRPPPADGRPTTATLLR